MRLYSRTGATAVMVDGQRYEAVEDGGFDLPDHIAQVQHGMHIKGQPLWETSIERQNRLMREELERRKDPTTLLGAVEQILAAAQAAQQPAAPKRARRSRAKPAAESAPAEV